MRLLAAALLVASLVATAGAAPGAPTDERARIDALVAAVQASDVTFVRNGRNHTAAEAADHLRTKWRAAGSRIKTAEDFIEGAGSRSSTTGRAYEVILKDGARREAGPWLRDLLAAIDARRR